MTQQALAERLGLDKGWISRAVDALATDGCIEKLPNEQDRRSSVLSLTVSGRARAGCLEADLNQHAAQLLESLPVDAHLQVQESLQILLRALSGQDDRVRACDGLKLRPAVDGDWPTIERLLRAEGLPREGALEHLADFVVGEIGGALVCTAGLEIYGDSALLRSVVVAPIARGRNCANGMAQSLVTHMRRLGARVVPTASRSRQQYM